MKKETRSHVSSKRVILADPEFHSLETTNFSVLALLRYQHAKKSLNYIEMVGRGHKPESGRESKVEIV